MKAAFLLQPVSSSPPIDSAPSSPSGSPAYSPPPPPPPPVSAYFTNGGAAESLSLPLGEDELSALYSNLELKIVMQPPTKTVYQRILKPFPCVVLVAKEDEAGPELLAELACAATSHTTNGTANSSTQHVAGLFVEASLVRSDTGAPVTKCLDGNSTAQFERSSWNGGSPTATFKKLKILSTSQQLQGALLRLKFTLKRYTGTAFDTIPNRCSVLSHPIEIFSHSQYLRRKEKQDAEIDQDRQRLRRIDPRDKVHLNLITAIKKFKERGGTREMLALCVDACFDEDSPSSHPPSSSSSLPSVSSLFASWAISTDNGAASRHVGPTQNASSTSTSPSKNNEIGHRGTKRRHEASSAQQPQQLLPPIRQQLGSVLVSPQRQQAGVKDIDSKTEVATQPHAVQQSRHISSEHSRIELVESSSPTSTSSSSSSFSSSLQILPPLSALSLLPPPPIATNSASYTPISPYPISVPPSPELRRADPVLASIMPFLHAHAAAFSQAYHAIAAQQMYPSAQRSHATGGSTDSVGKRTRQPLP